MSRGRRKQENKKEKNTGVEDKREKLEKKKWKEKYNILEENGESEGQMKKKNETK